MSTKIDMQSVAQVLVTRLAALHDEARLRVHLLSSDARTRWNRLDGDVAALAKRANTEDEAPEVVEVARRLTRELTDFMVTHLNHSVGLLTAACSLMTTPVGSCSSDDLLTRAAQLMWEQRCGALPVVVHGRVVAMLTDRDICMAAYTQGKPLSEIHVDSAMSKELFSCSPDDSVGAVFAVLADRRVRRLPVIDQNRGLLGIITLADLARWARSIANPAVDAALADTLGLISSAPAHRAPARR